MFLTNRCFQFVYTFWAFWHFALFSTPLFCFWTSQLSVCTVLSNQKKEFCATCKICFMEYSTRIQDPAFVGLVFMEVYLWVELCFGKHLRGVIFGSSGACIFCISNHYMLHSMHFTLLIPAFCVVRTSDSCTPLTTSFLYF